MILICVWVFSAGFVQDAFPGQSDILIESVSVSVDDQPGSENVAKLIAVQPGEIFSLTKINYSIKQLYKTGMFSDVRVFKQGTDRIQLIFQLTSRPFSRAVHILGIDSIPDKISGPRCRSSIVSSNGTIGNCRSVCCCASLAS